MTREPFPIDCGISLPEYPLLLYRTPPALEALLNQVGLSCRDVSRSLIASRSQGKFVLYDGREPNIKSVLAKLLTKDHHPIDIRSLWDRSQFVDPFSDWLATRSRTTTWAYRGYDLRERVAIVDRALIRDQVVGRLRSILEEAGSLWIRVMPYPYPYRSAFNFRVDLDESVPQDYRTFLRDSDPLKSSISTVVSTAAYGDQKDLLQKLRGHDVLSHGHYHVIYRDVESNLENLQRAEAILAREGFRPEGFAAPEGRWHVGLDHVLDRLGYRYSSEFEVGYDDLPFRPWLGDRFSRLWQIPIHPICEGLFQLAGCHDESTLTDYFALILRSRLQRGDPAFLYGHPEGRLARYPSLFPTLCRILDDSPLTWKTTLSEFSRWWSFRDRRRWSIDRPTESRVRIRGSLGDACYPIGLEIVRGMHRAIVPWTGSEQWIDLRDYAFERLPEPSTRILSHRAHRNQGPKAWLKTWLDWETVTPIEDLKGCGFRGQLKRQLRRLKGGI